MKKIFSAFSAFLFAAGINLHAQNAITYKTSPLEAPKIVNFTQLAEYELIHPPEKTQRFIEQGEDKEENFRFTPKPVPPGSRLFNVELPQSLRTQSPEASSPAPKISFNGTLDNGSFIPPDIQGAAGPVYLMETTNQSIDIRTKTGTLHSSVSTASFFGSTGGTGFFDPHVYFDPSYGRYIICIAGYLSNSHSGVFIAVSQTNDPTGSWYEYSHDGTGNTTDLLDFPLLGYNTNWVVITGNDFMASSTAAEIFVFNRAGIYSGTIGTVTDITDNNSFTLCPAETQDNTEATEYFVTDYNGDYAGNGYVKIFSIAGAVNAPAYAAVNTIGVNQPWSEVGVDPTQEGSSQTLDVPDSRFGGGAVYINGSLWFAHSVFLPAASPTHDAVDWWQVDPAGGTLQQFGRINDATGVTNYFYPSINVNSANDALLGYCESGTNNYPSASYSFHANADAAGVMEDTYIAKAGVASYYKTFGGTRNRWGDFTFTCVDPTDNSFWTFSEWANTGNDWGTYISNVLSSGTTPCISPSDLITSGITDKAATLTWSSIGNAASYNVQYRMVGTLTWTTVNTTTTSYTISGLTGSTNYEWEVQTVCQDTSTSSYTSSITFLTLVPCNAVAPVSSGVTICSGNAATLTATGADSLFWYATPGGSTVIAVGTTYKTPTLTGNTIYYVESDVFPAIQPVGAASNSIGAGGYFTNTNYHDLIFNCSAPVKLVSVLVYASGAGNRTITLTDQLGDTLNEVTVNLPNGSSRVTLNFDVPVENNLELGMQGNVNVYRNSAGAAFPYTLTDVISITGTNATGQPGYYYYFYDWQIEGAACKSLRTAVNVTVNDAVAAFAFSTSGDSVIFDDQSSGATSWNWNFGDGDTSTQQNPTHKYLNNGNYSVTEVACTGNCCDTIIHNVQIINTGIASVQGEGDNAVKVYPNPVKDNLQVVFGSSMQGLPCLLTLSNSIGQAVMEESLSAGDVSRGFVLNTSSVSRGVYTLIIQNEQGKFIQKMIKE